jgi:LmbE family N-acetylglucosaminyl deacetylase
MNILAFFAHPDDETMLSGGALALLARNGAQVHYLCATRGEGGEVGEPPLCRVDDLGELRQQEMACAVQVLGGHSLTFFDYVDPRIGQYDELYPYTDDLALLTQQVVNLIMKHQAKIVITHGSNGEYGHPAHVLTHKAARMAVESLNGSKSAPLMYTVVAQFPDHPKPRLVNKDDPAHIVLDVTSVLSQKTEAAMCHRSQHALFVRRSSRAAGRQMSVPEVIMRLESLHRSWPEVKDLPDDILVDILRPWIVE